MNIKNEIQNPVTQIKKVALIEYLKTKPIDHWSTEEEIINALPEHFKAITPKGGTSLNRTIHTCMELTHWEAENIIINNGKRAYKLATIKEATEYTEKHFGLIFKKLKKIWRVRKAITEEDNYDLLVQDFNNEFVKELTNGQNQ